MQNVKFMHSNPACPDTGQIPAPGIKATFTFAPCYLCLSFPHSTTSATMERQLICPPRLLPPPPPPLPWALSSVRAGPHYSLLSLLAFRLQSLVLHSPVLVSLSCCGLQPYLPGPQSSRGCVLLSTRSTLFPIISFPRRWRQNIVPTCPQFRTERQHVVQSHRDCERLVQKVSSIHTAANGVLA